MSKRSGKLSEYGKKRDFSRTPEPQGRKRRHSDGWRFVIQKHDASHLHYDFRLEIDGVLKSWAVPKGPSVNPADKRLAIRTEDHPLDYLDFEGTIPDDAYGGGTVMVWDAGKYRNLRSGRDGDSLNMQGSLRGGLIEVWLEGEKLRGGFALKRIGGGKKAHWLLIKMADREADARRKPVHTRNKSVKSGRTMHQIATEERRGDS